MEQDILAFDDLAEEHTQWDRKGDRKVIHKVFLPSKPNDAPRAGVLCCIASCVPCETFCQQLYLGF